IFDLSRLPAHLVENIISHVSPTPNVLSCLLVSKRWSKAAARTLYRSPPLTTTDNFHLLVQTLLNAGTHAYPSFVLDLHVPTALSEHLLMGDIDIALQLCPNLRGIKLENCVTASNILMQSLGDHGRQLRQLMLRGCPISDVLLADLARCCPKLEVVDLAHTHVTAAAVCTLVDACDRIRHIDLEGCAASPRAVSFDPRRTSKRPLRYLNVRNGGVTDMHIRFVAERCPQLGTVILEGCSSLTDDALISLARNCGEYLGNLDASFCMKVTDLSVRALAQYGKRLEVLTLSGCDLITPDGVQAITRGCARLDEIVLHGCAKILSSFVREYSSRQYELDCAIRGPAVKWLAGHRTETAVVKRDVGPVVGVGVEQASKAQEQHVLMVDQMCQTDEVPREAKAESAEGEDKGEGEKAKDGAPDQANATEVLLKFAEAIAAGKWMPGGGFPGGPMGSPPMSTPGTPPYYGYGQYGPGPWGPPGPGMGYGFPHPAWTPGSGTPDDSKRRSTMSDASTTSGYSSMRSSYISTGSGVEGELGKSTTKTTHKRHSSGVARLATEKNSPSPPLSGKRLSTESASSIASTASRLKAPSASRLPGPRTSRLPPPSAVSRGAIPRASSAALPTPTPVSSARPSLARASTVTGTPTRPRQNSTSSPALAVNRPVGVVTPSSSRISSVSVPTASTSTTTGGATSTAYKPRGFRKFNSGADDFPSRSSTSTRPTTSSASTSTTTTPTPGTPKRLQHPMTPSRTSSGWIAGGTRVDPSENNSTPVSSPSSIVKSSWVSGRSDSVGSGVGTPTTPTGSRLKAPSVGGMSGLRPPTLMRTPSGGGVRTPLAKR
ncbi:hypothetical protein HK097_002767, partial [Rhizophlyctis rosea]